MPDPIRMVDPDTAPAGEGEVETDLDALRRELATPAAEERVKLEVGTREGYAVEYSTAIDHDAQLAPWEKRATTKGRVDEFKLALLILANLCTGVYRQGRLVTGDDGAPLTFANPDLWEVLGGAEAGVTRSTAAVRRFYGRDADIITTAGKLLAEAGYGDQALEAEERLDPTTG